MRRNERSHNTVVHLMLIIALYKIYIIYPHLPPMYEEPESHVPQMLDVFAHQGEFMLDRAVSGHFPGPSTLHTRFSLDPSIGPGSPGARIAFRPDFLPPSFHRSICSHRDRYRDASPPKCVQGTLGFLLPLAAEEERLWGSVDHRITGSTWIDTMSSWKPGAFWGRMGFKRTTQRMGKHSGTLCEAY